MLRDYVDGADQMQDVLDQLFHVSSSSSRLFVSNPVKGSLIFDILFRRQDNRLALPLCLLRASRSFKIFPICDSSKEGICRKDQLRLKILPSRRWSPRRWRRRWRTWETAQFANLPSKSATRSCFSLFSGFKTLSSTRRSSTLAALGRVSTVVTLTAFKDGSRGS